jgi:hypothetical protein
MKDLNQPPVLQDLYITAFCLVQEAGHPDCTSLLSIAQKSKASEQDLDACKRLIELVEKYSGTFSLAYVGECLGFRDDMFCRARAALAQKRHS